MSVTYKSLPLQRKYSKESNMCPGSAPGSAPNSTHGSVPCWASPDLSKGSSPDSSQVSAPESAPGTASPYSLPGIYPCPSPATASPGSYDISLERERLKFLSNWSIRLMTNVVCQAGYSSGRSLAAQMSTTFSGLNSLSRKMLQGLSLGPWPQPRPHFHIITDPPCQLQPQQTEKTLWELKFLQHKSKLKQVSNKVQIWHEI